MTHVRRPNRRRVPVLAAYADGALCRQTGKVRYLDERSASADLDELAKRDPSRARLNTWSCEHCADWHVGHRPKEPSDAD